MDIEAVIAEATKPVAEAQEATSTEVANVETQTPEQEAKEAESLKDKADSELTPEQLAKREKNRESHLNSKLAKLRRENRELKEFKTQLEQQTSKAQPQNSQTQANPSGAPVKPKESDYNSFMEFLEAKDAYYEQLSDWKVEQKLSERDNKVQAAQLDIKQVNRIQEMANQEEAFAKSNPEYAKLVYENHSDFMTNMPRAVAEALLEAENASLALFALAKEDRLEDLADLPIHRIAMEIGRAEERGKAYLSSGNKATNAPPPMQGLRGTGSASKSLDNKSVEELMKQFN